MSCKNAVKVLLGGALLFASLSFSCSQFAFLPAEWPCCFIKTMCLAFAFV